MPAERSLNDVLAVVAAEQDTDAVLDHLVRAALEVAGGTNSMIALLNEELACLEVAHGAGAEWKAEDGNERMLLQVNMREGIVSYVAATGHTYVTGDIRQETRYRNLVDSTLSELAVPIRDREGRLRGVLNVESSQPQAFNDTAQVKCEALALMAGLAIERQDALMREEALLEVGGALDTSLSEEALVERVIEIAGEVLRFQAFSIFLLDDATGEYVLRGSVGRLKSEVGRIGYKLGEGCTGWVCEHAESILLANPQSDSRWRGRYLEFPSEQIASFLAVPVVARGRCIGALRAIRRTMENPYLDNTFSPSDQRLLEAVGDQMAAGLEGIRNVEKLVRSERMIAWGELSAKSSHMIGNRIFALKGDVNELTHLLASDAPQVEELRAIQGSLATNVTRVEEILQDFRDFVTATQIELAPSDLNEVVLQTVQEMLPGSQQQRAKLSLANDLPRVPLDGKKLRRAILELLENAFSYTEDGTVAVATGIAVREEMRAADRVAEKRMVKIEVQDAGPGVPDDKKRMIFQPFFSSRVKGMGLGLSIVKGIVDAHGGSVYEDGAPGSGAKFVVLLPIGKRHRK